MPMLTAVCCLLALAGGPLFQGDASPAAKADRAELERLETVWNEAHERGDADALDRLWDDQLVVTVPGMLPMGKAESLEIWRSGKMRFERYKTSNLDIHLFGDAATVTGRLQRERITDGRRVSDDWRFTKTYVRRGALWRVVAWHASESPK